MVSAGTGDAAGFAAWALAHVREGERLLWLGPGGEGAAAAGPHVRGVALAAGDGAWEAQVRDFAPQWVVLGAEPSAPLLQRLFAAAPAARVLLQLENPASSAALLRRVTGRSAAAGPGAAQLDALLAAARCRVAERIALPVEAAEDAGLAQDARQALQGLLQQLSEDAGVGAWRLVLEEGPGAARPAAPTPGLLSVLLDADAPADPVRLDALLFSLACQEQRPFELLLCGAGADALQARAEVYRRVEDFEVRCVRGALAQGVEAARGQYLALLGADCVVYPAHFVRLLAALREGTQAWSISRVRDARLRPDGSGYVEHKGWAPAGETLGLAELVEEPALVHALVVDRLRLGAFPLLPEGVPLQALPLRLAALFAPHFVAGVPSLEVQREAAPAPLVAPSGLLALRSVESLRALERAQGGGGAAAGLRHRVLDELNAQLLHRVPGVHARLKVLARRWLRDAAADRS